MRRRAQVDEQEQRLAKQEADAARLEADTRRVLSEVQVWTGMVRQAMATAQRGVVPR